MIQKTWFESFGSITSLDYADGKDLVRWMGGDEYKLLLTFESAEQAQAAFDQWMIETMQAQSNANRCGC